MHSDQEPYRELYDAILDYEGSEVFADVVRPWLGRADGERRWLESFGGRRGDPIPEATQEESWRLYALSRIAQFLHLGLGPFERKEGEWGIETVRREEYEHFMESLGLQRIARRPFHPFFHEVVTVEQVAPETAVPVVLDEYWPGYMLGPLLITRAGCAVSAGAGQIRKEIAETSTLYWAFARRSRPYEDPSVGWGSNSQWRTSFRRDYAAGGMLYFNVDGTARRPPDDDLDPAERLELLRYRCFVRCTKSHSDRWPYDDSHSEPQ